MRLFRKKKKEEVIEITQEELINNLIKEGYDELNYEQFLKLSITHDDCGYRASYKNYNFTIDYYAITYCVNLKLFFKDDLWKRYINDLDEKNRNEILKK